MSHITHSSAFLILIFISALSILPAQTLTVRVVDKETGKPLKNAPVTIRYNFMKPRRAKPSELQTVNTDAEGKAMFANVHLEHGGFSVNVFSMTFGTDGLEPVFFIPAEASPKPLLNPTFTSLPADVTIRAHKRGLGEQLHLIFSRP